LCYHRFAGNSLTLSRYAQPRWLLAVIGSSNSFSNPYLDASPKIGNLSSTPAAATNQYLDSVSFSSVAFYFG
jgi:hypothetical protein